MGEVVIADNTVTGEGVVLAQRVEQLGQLQEARAEVVKLLELQPEFFIRTLVEKFYVKNPSDLEHHVDGLRKAGLAEHPPRKVPDKPATE